MQLEKLPDDANYWHELAKGKATQAFVVVGESKLYHVDHRLKTVHALPMHEEQLDNFIQTFRPKNEPRTLSIDEERYAFYLAGITKHDVYHGIINATLFINNIYTAASYYLFGNKQVDHVPSLETTVLNYYRGVTDLGVDLRNFILKPFTCFWLAGKEFGLGLRNLVYGIFNVGSEYGRQCFYDGLWNIVKSLSYLIFTAAYLLQQASRLVVRSLITILHLIFMSVANCINFVKFLVAELSELIFGKQEYQIIDDALVESVENKSSCSELDDGKSEEPEDVSKKTHSNGNNSFADDIFKGNGFALS